LSLCPWPAVASCEGRSASVCVCLRPINLFNPVDPVRRFFSFLAMPHAPSAMPSATPFQLSPLTFELVYSRLSASAHPLVSYESMGTGPSFQLRNEQFFARSRRTRGCAEAYRGTSHKQARSLTPRLRKRAIYGWKPAMTRHKVPYPL
jgi:hypothetical protein